MVTTNKNGADRLLLWGILLSLFVSMLALGIVAYLIFTISQVELETARVLGQMGTGLDTLLGANVEYTVQLDQNIPIDLDFPVNQELTVPVQVQINQEFPLKAAIPIDTQITAPISITIPVNQIFNASIKVLGQPITIPVEINGSLPVDITLDIPFEQTIQIDTMIPISMPLTAEFAVVISQTIPIRADFPLNTSFPVQLSLENSTTAEFLLGLQSAALRMDVSSKQMVVVVWLLAGLVFLTLAAALLILRLYSVSSRQEVSSDSMTERVE